MAQVWAYHDWFKPPVGETWLNDSDRILYQWHCNFANSCARCIEMAGSIGRWWPVPVHRGCRCYNIPIVPGQRSEPGLDYREEVRKLDPVQQARVMGIENLRLVEAGLVEWGEVVERTRIKTFKQVIDEHKLTYNQLRRAGITDAKIRAAMAELDRPAAELSERRREVLIAALQGRGLTREQIRSELGRRLAARVGIRRPSEGGGPIPPAPAPPPPRPPRDFSGQPIREIVAWQREQFETWQESLDHAERRALNDYGGNTYGPINNALRRGTLDHKTMDWAKRDVAAIDLAIAKGRIPEPVIVYRRVESLPIELEPGGRLTDPAYMSTTLEGEWLKRQSISGGVGDLPVILRIEVPAGTPAASMIDFGIEREVELLLGRGTTIEIVAVTDGTLDNGRPYKHVQARVIPGVSDGDD